jgi:putative FmdB family regulatory protein
LPTYEYHCDSCDRNFDVVQSFHDDPITTCPTCGSPVRKVFGNVGIVFKGSGFYKTDSRSGAPSKRSDADAPAASTPGSEGSGSGSDGAGTAHDGSSTTPAAPSPSPSTGSDTSSGGSDNAKTSRANPAPA